MYDMTDKRYQVCTSTRPAWKKLQLHSSTGSTAKSQHIHTHSSQLYSSCPDISQHHLEDATQCINIRKSTILPGTANSVQSFDTKDHRSLLQTTFLPCKEESVALCLSGRPSMSTSPAAINTIATHTIYSICLHKFHVVPKQAPFFKSEPLAQCSNVIWVETLQQLPGNCRHLLF